MVYTGGEAGPAPRTICFRLSPSPPLHTSFCFCKGCFFFSVRINNGCFLMSGSFLPFHAQPVSWRW